VLQMVLEQLVGPGYTLTSTTDNTPPRTQEWQRQSHVVKGPTREGQECNSKNIFP